MNGWQCKLYINDGTYESPDWKLVDAIKDVVVSLGGDEADTTTRADGGYKTTDLALIDATISFPMEWNPGDDNFKAIREAYFGRTGIEVAALDGAIDDNGSQGLRATMAVVGFERQEPLNGPVQVNVTLKPKRAENPPAWMTVATGGGGGGGGGGGSE